MKKYKTKILILLSVLVFMSSYFFINSLIEKNKFLNLKSFLTIDQKNFLKKYVFPYRLISQQEQIISQLEEGDELLYAELYFRTIKSEIETKKNDIKLSNDKILRKYNLLQIR